MSRGAQQIICREADPRPVRQPQPRPLLEALQADEYVVYGVVTEYCVRYAALGLLDTGKPVTLVTDAVETLKREDSDRTLREFTARGGKLAAAGRICGE